MVQSRYRKFLILVLLVLLTAACHRRPEDQESYQVKSPGGTIQVTVTLSDGAPYYKVDYRGNSVILPSKLGFRFKQADPLDGNLRVLRSETASFDETWTQPWGEVKDIRNHYNEL